jgi:peptidoglycan-associated lipoprotein
MALLDPSETKPKDPLVSGPVSGRSKKYGDAGMTLANMIRGAKFAAIVMASLAIAGCAKNNDQNAALAGAAAPGSQQDFVVNVGDRVFFETDSSELTDQARATLDKQAQWLGNYNRYSFTIEGHADERGTREYNIALGARRAETVRQYLATRGLAASRMRTISYGKERPVAVCNDISCWSQNRRAVTVLDQSS